MARPLRIERVGGWYHVTSRGNERRPIFRDEADRRHFLEMMEEMVTLYRIRLHAYVLMENHYHLILELIEANLSRAVQWLNLSYSVWFNRRHRRSGHLFQGRFKSVIVSRDEWGLELSRYVHLNPVRIARLGLGKDHRAIQRAGLGPAPDPGQIRERMQCLRRHRWSSYPAYVGQVAAPKWLECETVLGLGGGPKREWRKRYRQFMEAAVRDGLKESPWESLHEQVILGGVRFLSGLKKQIAGDAQEQRSAQRLVSERPEFSAVIGAIETEKGEKWDKFRERHGDTGRDMALYLGRRLCGMKLRELAKAAGVKNYAVVATNTRRYEKRLARNRTEQAAVKNVLQMLNCKM